MFAYATVITTDHQLADAVVLAYSLRSNGSQFPLVVLCSKAISPAALEALNDATDSLNMRIERISGSQEGHGPEQLSKESKVDESSLDQLQVFAPSLRSYEMVCYVAAGSVLVGSGMDLVFTEAQLPTDDWLAATNLCSCADGKNPAAESLSPMFSFVEQSCPYLNEGQKIRRTLSFSAAPSPIEMEPPVTAVFDSRLLVFYPSERLWNRVTKILARNRRGPIQVDKVLNEAFRGKWMPLTWQYFGSESIHVWHKALWDQERAICVHPDDQVRNKSSNDQVEDGSRQLRQLWKTAFRNWQEETNGNEKLSKLHNILKVQTKDEGGDGLSTESGKNMVESSKPGSVPTGATSELRTDYSQIYANKGTAEQGHGPVIHSG